MGLGMGWPLDAALLHAGFFLFGILLPGAALISLLPPDVEEPGGPRAFLRLAAAGVLWNALLFGVLLVLRPSGALSSVSVLGGALGAGAILVLAALLFRRAHLTALILAGARGVSLPLAVLAVLCGVVALRSFPHVSDCIQLQWTELLAAGRNAGGDSGALGFSAWMLFAGHLRADLPLVSSGAGSRIPLFLLAFVAAHALIVAAAVRRVALGTGLLILMILASYFGRIGLVEFGKDSLFGLVFAVAYAAALPRKRPEDGRRDRGLFFAAAVLLGVISFPFLAVLAALDLAFRLPEGGLRSEFRSLALFAIPATLPSIAAMSPAPRPLIAAILFGAAVLALALPERPVEIAWKASGAVARLLPAALFVGLVAAGALLMPIRLLILTRYDAARLPILDAWPPLDGRTSFASYLLASGGSRYIPVAAAGILGVLVYLLRRPERRDRSLAAIALTPMILSVLGLILAILPVRPLRPFHVWDLVKDVPLWLEGPFWGLFAVLAVDVLLGRLRKNFSDRALTIGLAGLVLVAVVAKRRTLLVTFRPAVLTPAAGHQDADVADLYQDVWDLRADTRTILAPERSFATRFLPEVLCFTFSFAAHTGEISPSDVEIAPADLPALVVVDPPGAQRLLARAGVRVVRHFEEKGELLLWIPAHGPPSKS
ncbi:MAG: hypothetical protein ACHQPI_07570 [Thermoanaerobaculia bacterium]